MNYVRILPENGADEVCCELIRNYFSSYKLSKGIPLAGELPPDAEFRMSDDFPTQLTLVDVLYVLENVLVVAPRARALLEERAGADIEFLPVAVVNHKGRKVKEPYVIANLLRVVDCIDKTKTTWEPSSLDPDAMDSVSNLTLDEARIPPDAQIFRPQGLLTIMVARRDLADHLLEAGVKGLGVAELEDFAS